MSCQLRELAPLIAMGATGALAINQAELVFRPVFLNQLGVKTQRKQSISGRREVAAPSSVERSGGQSGSTNSPWGTPETLRVHSCSCGRSFTTYRGLKVHASRMHHEVIEAQPGLKSANCGVPEAAKTGASQDRSEMKGRPVAQVSKTDSASSIDEIWPAEVSDAKSASNRFEVRQTRALAKAARMPETK